ncbi:MAG: glycosyltransferase family 2 protein, partial [Brevinematales bacterium]|nr:glycosyltransferase family 2 protein [Brevinematales bacterium]
NNHTIIVVDNNSRDNDRKILRTFFNELPTSTIIYESKLQDKDYLPSILMKNPKFILILLDNNYGYAKGNNFGLRLAKRMNFSYAIISNNDIKIEEPVVESLVRVIQSYNDVAIVGPKILGLDGKSQGPFKKPGIKEYIIYPFFYPILYPFLKLRSIIISKINKNSEPEEKVIFPYRLMGCFMLVNLDILEKVDFFSEETFLYAEELILAEKLEKLGYKTAYYPKVSILHLHGETTKLLGYKKMYFMDVESNIIYLRNYRKYSEVFISLFKLSKTFYFYFWIPILSLIRVIKNLLLKKI